MTELQSTRSRIFLFLFLLVISIVAFFAYQQIRNQRQEVVSFGADQAFLQKNIALCYQGDQKNHGDDCARTIYPAFVDKNVCQYIPSDGVKKQCSEYYETLTQKWNEMKPMLKAPLVYNFHKAELVFTDGQKKHISLEMADSPEKRTRGFSYRESIDPNVGMIFVFDEMGSHPFHMKDMFSPLDIYFLNTDKKIIGEVRYATTCLVMKVCSLIGEQYKDTKYVVEVFPQGKQVKEIVW